MKEKLNIENKITKEYCEMKGLKVINRKGNLFINLNDIVDDNNFQILNTIREFIKDPKNFKKETWRDKYRKVSFKRGKYKRWRNQRKSCLFKR